MKLKIAALILFCGPGILIAQDNIAEAKSNYGVGDQVTVTGIVTNGSELGSIRYIQDETGGIALYPGVNWNNLDFTPQPGDEVSITGTLSMFANLLEVGPVISELSLISSGNPLPEPIVLTPNQLNESYEGRIVRINAINFSGGGSIFGTSTYGFTDVNGEEGVIYVNANSNLIGELVPLGTLDLVGILSQFSYNNPATGYQVLPRSTDDFITEFPINFASVVTQTNLSTSSITLDWITDVASSTGIFYGLTPDLGSEFHIDESTNEHEITIEGLLSGMPYFCKVYSVVGADTAFSNIGVYSTVSESSGRISVYFNRNVDTGVSTGVDAISLFQATDDTIVAQIDRAQTSLDIAAYNNNNGPIVQAINAAYDRGVVVRYIAEGQTANTALASLNNAIPVLYRQNATSSGMHNKFIIVDAENVDSAIVLTGSTNFTSNNLFSDPNNMVIIQDQALARAYTLEFNEMWGSDLPEPNQANSRFGELKINNTPEKFLIGGKAVELYFSPSDNTTGAIENAIETSYYDLDFALLTFTNNTLADAVADKVSLILTPRGIVETPGGSGSDFDFLLDAGVMMLSHEGIPGQLHHKYAIINHSQPASDPMVITGSHNWSAAAETENDENTLIIHDATVANLFYQEFMALYNVVSSIEELEVNHLSLYPNPASEVFTLVFDAQTSVDGTLMISDIQGKTVFTQDFKSLSGSNKMEIYIGGLQKGVYTVSLLGNWGMSTAKLVKI